MTYTKLLQNLTSNQSTQPKYVFVSRATLFPCLQCTNIVIVQHWTQHVYLF